MSNYETVKILVMKFLRNAIPESFRPNLKLFYSHYSPPARSVYLVAKALNLNMLVENYDILNKNYLTPDLLKINPQHTIPTLQDDNFVIWDSHAIAGYLVNKYAPNDSLYPNDPEKRAVIDQRLHFDTENLYPKIYDAFYPILFKGKHSIPSEIQIKVKLSYSFLEKFLKSNPWLAGSNVTIADLCCVSSISTLDYVMPISKKEFPKLANFLENCRNLPYYYEANQLGLDIFGRKIHEELHKTYLRRRAAQVFA